MTIPPVKQHTMVKGGQMYRTYLCPVCGKETEPATSTPAAIARLKAHMHNEHPA